MLAQGLQFNPLFSCFGQQILDRLVTISEQPGRGFVDGSEQLRIHERLVGWNLFLNFVEVHREARVKELTAFVKCHIVADKTMSNPTKTNEVHRTALRVPGVLWEQISDLKKNKIKNLRPGSKWTDTDQMIELLWAGIEAQKTKKA